LDILIGDDASDILKIEHCLKLFIKYMVSKRCKMAVKDELKKLGLHFIFVDMGVVDIMEDITTDQREHLRLALHKTGLELMEDKKSVLIEGIKNAVIEMVFSTNELTRKNFSEYISDRLKYNYTYLSDLFTEVQGTTIEKYVISQKIDRVKELIINDEYSLTEIAWNMQYSSVAHLSNQFKKITGLTPTNFKEIMNKRRKATQDI